MPHKGQKKSVSKFIEQDNNKQKGGLSNKDDPDKLDKEEFESEDEDVEEIEDIEKEEIEGNTEEETEGETEEEIEEESEKEEESGKEEDDVGKEEGEDRDDDCVYKLTKKKNTIDVEIESAEDNFEDDEFEKTKNDNDKYVKPNERKTKPFLFEFERVRILGERARQLTLGAKPMIKNIEKMDPKYIARLELEKKVIPIIILRELPNGLIEKWKVNELSY
jgi:DNA-directed RNA polymerase subunit K/omega